MRKSMVLFVLILITLSAACARKTPLQSVQLEMGTSYETLEPELTDPGKVTPLADNLLSPQEMRALQSEYAIRFCNDPYAKALVREPIHFSAPRCERQAAYLGGPGRLVSSVRKKRVQRTRPA